MFTYIGRCHSKRIFFCVESCTWLGNLFIWLINLFPRLLWPQFNLKYKYKMAMIYLKRGITLISCGNDLNITREQINKTWTEIKKSWDRILNLWPEYLIISWQKIVDLRPVREKYFEYFWLKFLFFSLTQIYCMTKDFKYSTWVMCARLHFCHFWTLTAPGQHSLLYGQETHPA